MKDNISSFTDSLIKIPMYEWRIMGKERHLQIDYQIIAPSSNIALKIFLIHCFSMEKQDYLDNYNESSKLEDANDPPDYLFDIDPNYNGIFIRNGGIPTLSTLRDGKPWIFSTHEYPLEEIDL